MIILKTKDKRPKLTNKIKLCVNPFVCLDDVVGSPKELNHVIYNPKMEFEHRKKLLHQYVKSLLNYDLTNDDLCMLCDFDCYHTNEFVHELRKILKSN